MSPRIFHRNLVFALLALVAILPTAVIAKSALVEIDQDDEDAVTQSQRVIPKVHVKSVAVRKAHSKPAAIHTTVKTVKVKPRVQARPEPADDEGTEASSEDTDLAPCLHCGEPVHQEPKRNFFQAIKDSMFPKTYDPLTLTGPNMSCSQIELLKGAKYNVRRVYGNHHGSHGLCGPAVGDSIRTAARLFSSGDRQMESLSNFQNYNQYGVLFNSILPRNGFKRLRVSRAEDAPDGTVLVYAGPCSDGYGDSSCQTNSPNAGERWGHVTIKGSTYMDGGKQWYYTDGQTPWAANRTRRRLIGVFMPPGFERGPCQEQN